MMNFQKEINLLLCCSRKELVPEDRYSFTSLIQSGVNWDYIVHASLKHGVMPLLYQNLTETFSTHVPEKVLRKFKLYYIQNSARNVFFSEKLKETLTLFDENEIKSAAFKGPVIAKLLYDDISLRQFDDLDILIQKEDVIKACDLLAKLGYNSDMKLTGKQEKVFLKNENSINLVSDDPHFIIELHWDLLGIYSSPKMTFNNLEKRFKTGFFFDKKIRSLSNEDLLVYLCMHGAKHSWTRLEWIYCVSELIHKKHGIDWPTVRDIADRMSCRRMLCLGLNLATALFKTPLPDECPEFIPKDPTVDRLSETIITNIFQQEENTFQQSLSKRYSLFHLKVREKPADRITYILKLLFQPTEKEWINYSLPSYFSVMHYMIRPIVLFASLIKIFFQSLKSQGKPSLGTQK